MVFRFNCFEFLALATGFDGNQTQIKSVYYSAYPDFPEKRNLFKVFTYLELSEATHNFSPSSKIGDWEFGSVHKAVFKYQDLVVKRINQRYVKEYKKWVKEVNVLGLIRHPNLVKLVGFCAEDNETGRQCLLVYDYSYNCKLTRSIEDHLFTSVGIPLSWTMRLKVAKDVADGLAHLHEGTDNQVIFGDFKSSNVLVDKYSRVKLSDYGLGLLVNRKNLTRESTAVVRTTGYAAPEYIYTGHQTSESEVYSYGVFLYELITGRRSLDLNRPKNEQRLLEWVKPYANSKNLQLIIDSKLQGNYSLESAQNLAVIANMCLSRNPKLRPKMSEVKNMVWQLFNASTLVNLSDIQKILIDFFEDRDVKDGSVSTDVRRKKSVCSCRTRSSQLLKSCFRKIYCCG